MTFTEFCEHILIGLYQDGHESTDWIALADLQIRYGLEADLSWLPRSAQYLNSQGHAEIRELAGAPEATMARLTGSGLIYIENRYGDKDGVGRIMEPVASGQNTKETSIFVDSTLWTGLPREGFLSVAAVEKLKMALYVTEDALTQGNASNEEVAQARAYIFAIHALAEAPSPPADLIWQIAERANSIAGIASFFVSVMALFVASVH